MKGYEKGYTEREFGMDCYGEMDISELRDLGEGRGGRKG